MDLVNLKPGNLLAERYEITRTLYSGQTSTLYLCLDRDRGNIYALKEIWGGKLPDEEKNMSVQVFEQEIIILRTLRHRGIPQFLDNFSEGIWHYLLMEYIEGKTLRDIKDGKKAPIDVIEAVQCAIQICNVLYFLHNRAMPIVFRDLTPQNIMLSAAGDIKLTDFGLARYFDTVKKNDTYVMGTFGYASPEQYGKQQTSPRADIYSLGATLYDLLTTEDVRTFLFDFPPIRQFNSKVPLWLEGTIAQCLEKDPAKRHENALLLMQKLEKGLGRLQEH